MLPIHNEKRFGPRSLLNQEDGVFDIAAGNGITGISGTSAGCRIRRDDPDKDDIL